MSDALQLLITALIAIFWFFRSEYWQRKFKAERQQAEQLQKQLAAEKRNAYICG